MWEGSEAGLKLLKSLGQQQPRELGLLSKNRGGSGDLFDEGLVGVRKGV